MPLFLGFCTFLNKKKYFCFEPSEGEYKCAQMHPKAQIFEVLFEYLRSLPLAGVVLGLSIFRRRHKLTRGKPVKITVFSAGILHVPKIML